MITKRMILVTVSVLLFCLSPAWGDQNPVQPDSKSRIAWIQKTLNEGAGKSKLWQYGWTGIYGTITLAKTANAIDKDGDDDENKRFDSTVNATTSFLGFGSMIFDPLTSYSAADKLKKMPDVTINEKKIKLVEAEKLLTACAKREERGRSWQTHALAALVNVLAGIAVANDGSREDDGLVMFATGMVVSEIQIITMPTRAIDDLKRYKSQNFAHRRQSKPQNLIVNAMPNGLKLTYIF